MIAMIHFLRNLFRPAPIVVQTYKTRKTDLEAKRRAKTAQLCRELNWKEFPLRPPAYDPNERVTIAAFGEDN